MNAVTTSLRFAALLDRFGYYEAADTVDRWVRMAEGLNTGVVPPAALQHLPGSYLDMQDSLQRGPKHRLQEDDPEEGDDEDEGRRDLYLHNPFSRRHYVGVPMLAPGDAVIAGDVEYISVPAAIALEMQGHPVSIHLEPEYAKHLMQLPQMQDYRRSLERQNDIARHDGWYTPSQELYTDSQPSPAAAVPPPWQTDPRIQDFLARQRQSQPDVTPGSMSGDNRERKQTGLDA